jgi:hypothetical protein
VGAHFAEHNSSIGGSALRFGAHRYAQPQAKGLALAADDISPHAKGTFALKRASPVARALL